MNLLFVGLLSVAVCRLFARYNPSVGARTLIVLNLFRGRLGHRGVRRARPRPRRGALGD